MEMQVQNEYERGKFNRYVFKWRKTEYEIENQPYRLNVRKKGGDLLCSISVDTYYDCGVLIGDVLYWGGRRGVIRGYDLAQKKRCFFSYINDEAEAFYRAEAAKYPYSYPPDGGDYDNLPEILLDNYVISQNNITVLSAHRDYLLAGDLSGRVSVFDTETQKLVKTLRVEGGVCGIKVEGGQMVIDYIRSDRLETADDLARFKEATRTSVPFDLKKRKGIFTRIFGRFRKK